MIVEAHLAKGVTTVGSMRGLEALEADWAVGTAAENRQGLDSPCDTIVIHVVGYFQG